MKPKLMSARTALLAYYGAFAALGMWLWQLAEPDWRAAPLRADGAGEGQALASLTGIAGKLGHDDGRGWRLQGARVELVSEHDIVVDEPRLDFAEGGWSWRITAKSMRIEGQAPIELRGQARLRGNDRETGLLLESEAIAIDSGAASLRSLDSCRIRLDSGIEARAERCQALLDGKQIHALGRVRTRL